MFDNCQQLLVMKKFECFLEYLFDIPNGKWGRVSEIVAFLKLDIGGVDENAYVAWLADPVGHPDNVFILFHDINSGETITADYNRARLEGAN